jgi:FMN phosphatase YigB (HAD superfamily)
VAIAPLALLVSGVEVLCLDAGNTVIFLDHERLARLLARAGFRTDARGLVRAEGLAKRDQELETLLDPDWPGRALPGARPWGAMVGTIVTHAGVPAKALPDLLPAIWEDHVALNLWSRVPDGLPAALSRIRGLGVRVVIVSNSEGMLEPLFERLGLRAHLDRVVDSALAGIAKPDPGIFLEALRPYGTPPGKALHLGDSIATDVAGAKAAGVRVALVDPYGHCAGRALDVPRVPGAVEVAHAIAADRGA